MYLSPLDSVFFSESAELWKKGRKKKRKRKMGKLIVQKKSAKLRQNRLRQWVLCLNDSSEILWCPFDSVQKSQIHGMIHCALAYRVPLNITMCAFETPQLTLRATCKRAQQFTMFRLFAWGEKFNWFQTLRNNSQQHATTCNRVCKRTQPVTSNSFGSWSPTMLRLSATVFYSSKLRCEKERK